MSHLINVEYHSGNHIKINGRDITKDIKDFINEFENNEFNSIGSSIRMIGEASLWGKQDIERE